MNQQFKFDRSDHVARQMDIISLIAGGASDEMPLFQLIIDIVPDLIWAKNMRDEYLFVNRAMCDKLLMTENTGDVIGKTDIFFAEKEKQAGHMHTFGEICVDSDLLVKKSKKAGRFIEEGRVRGQYLILDVHKAPFFDKQGRMIGTVGSGRDITGQTDIETRLLETREQFINVLNHLTSAVYVVDIDTKEILFINETMANYYGKSPDEFVGKTCWKVLMKDAEVPCSGCRNNQVLNKQEEVAGVWVSEYSNQWLDRIFEITDQVIKWSDDRMAKLTIATDITEKKQAMKSLEESEKKFRTLFNGIEDAIYVHPFKGQGFGNFIEVNDVACKRYGYSRAELKRITPEILHADGAEARKAGSVSQRGHLKKQGRIIFEVEHKKKNGEKFPVEICSTLFDLSGEKMILSAARDITDRKIAEKEKSDAMKFASEQEKYALVGQVAGKMAHDFNNILGAIMGHAEISLIDCREENTLESLNIILDQAVRGKNLTRNLVAFAKDQEPKEEYFSINSKIDLVIKLLEKDLDDTIVVREYNPGLPELLADPGMIEHALVNLVQNAIHAMSLVRKPKLIVRTYARKENLYIEIEDNGCGIPGDCLEDIYSPSFTLKGSRDVRGAYAPGIKGTGYGMSNVKKYIEKHKGRIGLKSRIDSGTVFTIVLPVIKKELTGKEKQMISARQVVTGKRILLVEDEPAIYSVQEKILTCPPFDHAVHVATTAKQATDAFDTQRFDLVSLDYLLPGSLNGLDVYKHIRKKDKSIPIIFVSGNFGFLESMKKISSSDPCMDHISKPCGNMVYVNTINKWLNKKFN